MLGGELLSGEMMAFDAIKAFFGVKSLVSEYIQDPDKANEIIGRLDEMQAQIRVAELNTKTIPWVDALHKVGRQLISVVSIIAPMTVLAIHPEIDLAKILTVAGIGAGPGGVYNIIKGKGR